MVVRKVRLENVYFERRLYSYLVDEKATVPELQEDYPARFRMDHPSAAALRAILPRDERHRVGLFGLHNPSQVTNYFLKGRGSIVFDALNRGFWEMLPLWKNSFPSANDPRNILSAPPFISRDELRDAVSYEDGVDRYSTEMEWFWSLLGRSHLRKLVRLLTWSRKIPAAGGYWRLGIIIKRANEGAKASMRITGRTLYLPAYSSKAEMKSALDALLLARG